MTAREMYPLTSLFAPFIIKYMEQLGESMDQWVTKAIALDKFTKDGVPTSAAIDYVASVVQAYKLLCVRRVRALVCISNVCCLLQDFKLPSLADSPGKLSFEGVLELFVKVRVAASQLQMLSYLFVHVVIGKECCFVLPSIRPQCPSDSPACRR